LDRTFRANELDSRNDQLAILWSTKSVDRI